MNIVQQRQEAVARMQRNTLNTIKQRCYAHLESVITSNPTATETIFRVPTYEVGMPYMDPGISVPYMIQVLRQDNFGVSQYDQTHIKIRWTQVRPTHTNRRVTSSSSAVRRPNSARLDPFYYQVLLNK